MKLLTDADFAVGSDFFSCFDFDFCACYDFFFVPDFVCGCGYGFFVE